MSITRRSMLLGGLAASGYSSFAFAADRIRLGQATTSLSFVEIFAARALDTFSQQDIALDWAQIPGGDPAALAAIDSGDLDLAAVGSDTPMAAIAKGQPFQIIYSLMSKFPYELTVSNAFLAKTGISKVAPLDERIAVMKTAVVGVSAVGGAQDRAARWLAIKGGLDGKAVKVAQVGSPPALGAALENGRIDAFMLSPPESVIAEARGYGTILVSPSSEIPGISGIPGLVLVASASPSAETKSRIIKTLRAINVASAALIGDTEKTSDAIQGAFFAKVPKEIIRASVKKLLDGLGNDGQLDAHAAALLRQFAIDTGGDAPAGDGFWTNDYAAAAHKA